MSKWSATKARRVYAALQRIGWTLKKQVGSHRKLQRHGWPNFTFCFHDSEEVAPRHSRKSEKTRASALRTSERDQCSRECFEKTRHPATVSPMELSMTEYRNLAESSRVFEQDLVTEALGRAGEFFSLELHFYRVACGVDLPAE